MNYESLANVKRLEVVLRGRKVGMLAETPDGVIAFQYASEWLRDGFSISPFSLPLERRVFTPRLHPFDGVFGVFSDSLPDGWGRLLVDRMLQEHGIHQQEIGSLPRLAIVGSSGSGALEYRPEINAASSQEIDDLDEISAKCAAVLATRTSPDLDALFVMGGSSGGARPKVFYQIDGEEWIVKFPSSIDPLSIGMDEYRLALAARESGIEVPDVHLLPSKRCEGYFATKRFDRIRQADGSLKKTHMASVSALLETSHRVPNLSYELLMRLTLRLTGSMEEVGKMFNLMAFNVLCGNCDDHTKNFTFLCDDEGSWRLSPAYDLTRNSGVNGERATTVNGKGREITEMDMLEVARTAGISKSSAIESIDCIRTALESAKSL